MNAIALENQKQGTPRSVWGLSSDIGDANIQGFATDISVNVGGKIDFKIATDSTNYKVDIYRLGYYGGDGARQVATFDKTLASAQVQPHPIVDQSLGLIDCGNWAVSTSWNVPADAVSGVYFAKLTRQDGTAGENLIPFIVRNDNSNSDIVFQTSDTTWQAYNPWGGGNLYGGTTPLNPADLIGYMPPNCHCGLGAVGRSYAVSYNRPFITATDPSFLASGPQDYLFSVEFPAIQWLEQNGYDISYISGVDSARSGAEILDHNVFMSVGHDEYWSGQQRANVEAARDAGVNLAFWSGNEAYWKVDWGTSIDGNGTPYRTMICYKDTWANADINPSNVATGTWRDPRFTDPGQEPENSLTGTMFTVDSYRSDTISIPYDMSQLRIWRNTSVANTQPGGSASLVNGLLGYEWDSDVDNGFRPAGLINMSLSTISVDTYLRDYGSTVGAGTASHSITMYRAESGALVFGAGTVYWSWGLNAQHDLPGVPVDKNVQQAMINMFADMGVQPTTIDASLVLATQSTDRTAPTSTITSPTAGSAYVEGQKFTISGTAQDTGGGRVAGIEVSVDNGQTWRKANGTSNWSYTWIAQATGNYVIKSRAADDSLNLETPATGKAISVSLPSTNSLWTFADAPVTQTTLDRTPVEVGVKFQASRNGAVTGIRFYKGFYNLGEHKVDLWTSTGTLLASGVSLNETATGWQTVTFASPVQITAGTTYVASYHSDGFYSSDTNYFATGRTNGFLSVQAGGGVYAYGAAGTFPNQTYNNENYWVDVVFAAGSAGPNHAPVAANDGGFAVGQNGMLSIAASSLLANDTDSDGDPLAITSVSNGANGTVSYNSQNNSVVFTPTAGYTGPASFSYAISDGRGGTGSATVNLTVQPTAPITGVTLFTSADTPSATPQTDASPVELGMKFTASSAGTISSIRYYKSAQDVGIHTGSLWSSTGALLATATFANETASGWQTVSFTNPVQVTAGTTYVASYHSNGRYITNSGYFNTAHTNGPLTAPSSASSGGNGVYAYGANSLFPSNSYNASNYWVDVVYNQAAPAANTAPVAVNDSGFTVAQNGVLTIAAASLLANDTDANGDPLTITGVSGGVNGTAAFNSQNNTVSFTPTAGYAGAASFAYAIADGRGGTASATASLTVQSAANTAPVAANDSGFTVAQNGVLTIAASSLLANDTDANGDPLTITGVSGGVNGAATFNSQTNTVSFTPTVGYTGPASFAYAISDGRGGTASATASLTVQSTPPPATGSTLFTAADTPSTTPQSDPNPVELGMKFTVSGAGAISGLRYYKSAQDVGTHTGSLWSSSGTLLATATFVNETASGWQNVTLSNAVQVAAGTTYVASYHSNGRYITDPGYFNTARTNGPLTAPSSASSGGNGVYAYGANSLFPSNSYNASNYWVDVVYNAAANVAPVATNDSGFTVVRDNVLTIAASSLLANDTDANGDTLTLTGVSGGVNGTAAFNSQTNTVSFTPTAGYTGAASFAYAISDGRGGTASATASLTVQTTAPAAGASLFAATDTPTTVAVNDPNAVELGMRFQADVAGTITGVRYYKGAGNVGTHTGSIWTATGTLLGTATFANETTSGWQTVQLAQPVAIQANTSYVVSYHTNGNYSTTANGFNANIDRGNLHGLASTATAGNGLYAYGASGTFPTNTFNKNNYYVDVVFQPQLAA